MIDETKHTDSLILNIFLFTFGKGFELNFKENTFDI